MANDDMGHELGSFNSLNTRLKKKSLQNTGTLIYIIHNIAKLLFNLISFVPTFNFKLDQPECIENWKLNVKSLLSYTCQIPWKDKPKMIFLLFGRAESSEDDQTAEKPNK